MRTVTFTLDVQTGDDGMAPATITIVELGDGSLGFTISNNQDSDGLIADLRGLFFDVADDGLLGTFVFDGTQITEIEQDGIVSNLGGGVSTNGIPDGPYEVGVEFGTPGMSTDDYQTVTFTLSSSLRDLSIDDIALEGIAVRQTSVTSADGGREDSDKLYGDTPYPVNAADDAAETYEDETVSGNVFENDVDMDAGDANGDSMPDGLVVTAIDGDPASVGVALELAPGIIVNVNADGSYTLDATDADWLEEGEVWQGTVTYSVSDGNGGSDTATLSITVTGLADEEPQDEDHFGTFSNKKGTAEHDISNVVLYLDDGAGDILKVKIDDWSGISDLDDVGLDSFMENAGFEEYELLAVSIKAGNNHNKDLGPGEGQLFLLDGDEDIDYVEGGEVPDGLTSAILGAKADETFAYDDGLFM